jgi:nickel superoxide dismutase
MKSNSKIYAVLLLLVGSVFINTRSYAHCEVPCGIYDDSVRVALIYEHITTIEKAINNINKLSE